MPGVGLDVNSRQTIAVEVTRAGQQYRIGRSAVLPGYTHDAGKTADAAAASPLAEALRNAPPSLRKGAAVSLPGKDVIFRMTEVGSSGRSAIAALVRLEVDELTGGGSPMLPAFQIVTPLESAPMAMIGVAREEMIEHYSGTLSAAGLRAGCFVPGPVALFHAYLVSGPVDQLGTQMIVNVGEDGTDIAIVNGPDLLACRSLSMGVESMVTALARSLGVNPEQARETLFRRVDMKPGLAGANMSGERAVAAAQDAVSQLFMQLNGTIAYARGQLSMPKLEIVQLVLCGSGASIKGLPEFLQSRFRKPVKLLNPLSGFDATGLDDETLAAMGQYTPALAVPLGLAVMSADRDENDLKFVPPSVTARQRFLARTIWLYAGFLIILAATVFVILLASASAERAAQTKKDADAMQKRYNAGRRDGERPGSLPARTDSLREKLQHLSPVDKERMDAAQRLVEISEVRRPSLYATELCFHLLKTLDEQVTMTAFTMEPIPQGDGNDLIGVKIGVFLEAGKLKPADLYKALETDFRKHRCVQSVAVQTLTSKDGKGSQGELLIVLRDAAALLESLEKTE